MQSQFYEERKINIVSFYYFMVIVYLFFRMNSYLGTSRINEISLFVFRTLIIGLVVFKVLQMRVIPKVSFLGWACLFWFLSIIVTLPHATSSWDMVYNSISQSWWFFFCLFFVLHRNRINEVTKDSLINLSTIGFFVFVAKYGVWLLNPNRFWSAGGINSVYYCVFFLPMITMQKNKLLRYFPLIIAAMLAIISNKRGAMLAVLISTFVPLIISNVKYQKGRKRRNTLVLLLVACLVIYYLIQYASQYFSIDVFNRFQQLYEDGGSGRSEIYDLVWTAFKNSSVVEKIIGHGFNGVYLDKVTTTSAHNDFLEIIYDYGVLGLLTYVGFILSWIPLMKKLYRRGSDLFSGCVSALASFIVVSMVSHLILYPTYIVFLLLPFCLAVENTGMDYGLEVE